MNKTLDIANNAIDGAKQYDGNIYLTTVIVVGIFILLFLYVWYIHIPNMTASRESNKKLVEAMATLVYVAGDTHKTVESSHTNISVLDFRTERLMSCKRLECKILDKLSQASDIDISSELAEIKGLCTEANRPTTSLESWKTI